MNRSHPTLISIARSKGFEILGPLLSNSKTSRDVCDICLEPLTPYKGKLAGFYVTNRTAGWVATMCLPCATEPFRSRPLPGSRISTRSADYAGLRSASAVTE
jgi:hypothetical protein